MEKGCNKTIDPIEWKPRAASGKEAPYGLGIERSESEVKLLQLKIK